MYRATRNIVPGVDLAVDRILPNSKVERSGERPVSSKPEMLDGNGRRTPLGDGSNNA